MWQQGLLSQLPAFSVFDSVATWTNFRMQPGHCPSVHSRAPWYKKQGLERWVPSAQADIGAVGRCCIHKHQTSLRKIDQLRSSAIFPHLQPQAHLFLQTMFHVFLSNLMILKIWNTQHKKNTTTKVWFSINRGTSSPCCFLSLTTTFSQTKSHAAKARCSRRCCCCSSSKAKASARMRAASWGLQYHGPPKPTSLEGLYGK